MEQPDPLNEPSSRTPQGPDTLTPAEALAEIQLDDVPITERPDEVLVTFTRTRWEVPLDEKPVAGGMMHDDPRRQWRRHVRFPWSWGIDAPETDGLAVALETTLAGLQAPDPKPRDRIRHLLGTLGPWREHIMTAQSLRDIIAGKYGQRPETAELPPSGKPW